MHTYMHLCTHASSSSVHMITLYWLLGMILYHPAGCGVCVSVCLSDYFIRCSAHFTKSVKKDII